MKISFNILIAAALMMTISSCQKMDRPALADYAKDANAPGGPLNFYAAFDGSTTNVLMNAVDSIRATFASTNAMTSVTGVSGKGVSGNGTQTIKYPKPNDFAAKATSFTVAFWEKEMVCQSGKQNFRLLLHHPIITGQELLCFCYLIMLVPVQRMRLQP